MDRLADFATLTTPTRVQEGEFAANIPDGWQQGRGAFGGLVLANLVRAVRSCEPEADRTLRSLSAELVGPVLPGPARIRVEMLRRGSGVSTVAARLVQGKDDELLAHAVVVLGRTRSGVANFNRVAPPQPLPFAQTPPITDAPLAAARFAENLDFRPTTPPPFRADTQRVPVTSGWLRLRRPGAVMAEADLVALADGWWPCALSVEATPRPIGTLSFSLELLADPGQLSPHAPVYHRAEALASQDGYSVELRELWSESGTLLTLNRQTIAIIK